MSRTEEGLGHLFWAIFAGIGFACLFGYKAEVTLSKKNSGKLFSILFVIKYTKHNKLSDREVLAAN